jgi:hypothetical protein
VRKLIAVVAMVAGLIAVGVVAGVAHATPPWSCNPGECWWGYNYIGPANPQSNSPSNYWYDQYLDKKNGDDVLMDVQNSSGCVGATSAQGVVSWYHAIYSFYGCSGYLFEQMAYLGVGHRSFLFVETGA